MTAARWQVCQTSASSLSVLRTLTVYHLYYEENNWIFETIFNKCKNTLCVCVETIFMNV